jgi:gamma-glutamyl-gamma-aminobutyrate hydrolase PuuD
MRTNTLICITVDGLLFTGSYSNVEPHHYGGGPSAPGPLHDAARDATRAGCGAALTATHARALPALKQREQSCKTSTNF